MMAADPLVWDGSAPQRKVAGDPLALLRARIPQRPRPAWAVGLTLGSAANYMVPVAPVVNPQQKNEIVKKVYDDRNFHHREDLRKMADDDDCNFHHRKDLRKMKSKLNEYYIMPKEYRKLMKETKRAEQEFEKRKKKRAARRAKRRAELRAKITEEGALGQRQPSKLRGARVIKQVDYYNPLDLDCGDKVRWTGS